MQCKIQKKQHDVKKPATENTRGLLRKTHYTHLNIFFFVVHLNSATPVSIFKFRKSTVQGE